jgi:hypothetical protein
MRYEKCMPMLTNTTNGLQESTMAGESRAMKSIYPIGYRIEVPRGPPVPKLLNQEAAVVVTKAEPLLPTAGVEAMAGAATPGMNITLTAATVLESMALVGGVAVVVGDISADIVIRVIMVIMEAGTMGEAKVAAVMLYEGITMDIWVS